MNSDLNVAAYLQLHPQLTKENMPDFMGTVMPSLWLATPRIILDFIAIYVFGVFFWGLDPIDRPPPMSLSGFANYVWRYIQMVIIVECLGFLVGLVFATPIWIFHKLYPTVSKPPNILILIPLVAMFVTMAYWACRYVFVLPLAIQQISEPLTISLRLSREKVWRIVRQSLPFILVILPLAATIVLVSQLDHRVALNTTNRLIAEILSRMWISVFAITQDIVIACFMCSITRYFYKEMKESNSRFSLTQPPSL